MAQEQSLPEEFVALYRSRQDLDLRMGDASEMMTEVYTAMIERADSRLAELAAQPEVLERMRQQAETAAQFEHELEQLREIGVASGAITDQELEQRRTQVYEENPDLPVALKFMERFSDSEESPEPGPTAHDESLKPSADIVITLRSGVRIGGETIPARTRGDSKGRRDAQLRLDLLKFFVGRHGEVFLPRQAWDEVRKNDQYDSRAWRNIVEPWLDNLRVDDTRIVSKVSEPGKNPRYGVLGFEVSLEDRRERPDAFQPKTDDEYEFVDGSNIRGQSAIVASSLITADENQPVPLSKLGSLIYPDEEASAVRNRISAYVAILKPILASKAGLEVVRYRPQGEDVLFFTRPLEGPEVPVEPGYLSSVEVSTLLVMGLINGKVISELGLPPLPTAIAQLADSFMESMPNVERDKQAIQSLREAVLTKFRKLVEQPEFAEGLKQELSPDDLLFVLIDYIESLEADERQSIQDAFGAELLGSTYLSSGGRNDNVLGTESTYRLPSGNLIKVRNGRIPSTPSRSGASEDRTGGNLI